MNWGKIVGRTGTGAAIGSAGGPGWGTVIGGGVGLLEGLGEELFGGGDDESAQKQFEQMLAVYQDALKNYKGPDSDPGYAGEMSSLRDQAGGKLNAADRANMLEGYHHASDFAQGREGAIEQAQLARGGGVASSGRSAALQAVATQGGANRLRAADSATAATAANRGMQARLAYLTQLQRTADSANNYRLAASGMLGKGHETIGDYYGAKGQANQYAIEGAIDTAGRIAGAYAGRGGAPAAASQSVPQLGISLPNSGYTGGMQGYTAARAAPAPQPLDDTLSWLNSRGQQPGRRPVMPNYGGGR